MSIFRISLSIYAFTALMSAKVIWADEIFSEDYRLALNECYEMENLEDPIRQFTIGLLNEFLGDKEKAIEHYLKSASMGYTPAQHGLGVLLFLESSSTKDQKEGLKWLKTAATAGNRSSQLALGIYYEEQFILGDHNDPETLQKAKSWYAQAAYQGSTFVTAYLDDLTPESLDGQASVEVNPDHFVEAASNGDLEAQLAISDLYDFKFNDNLRSYYWLRRSANGSYPLAVKRLENSKITTKIRCYKLPTTE